MMSAPKSATARIPCRGSSRHLFNPVTTKVKTMSSNITRTPCAQAELHTSAAASKILKYAGYLLGLAAVSLAGYAGFQRGADTFQGTVWATVGLTAALGAMLIPARLNGTGAMTKAKLLPMYALAVVLAVSVGLGSAHSGRHLAGANVAYQTGVEQRANIAYAAALSRLKAKSLTSLERAQIEQDRDEARATLDALRPSAPANADAEAIAGYLEAFGFHVAPATIVLALQFAAVLFIEIAPGLLISCGGSVGGRVESATRTASATPTAPAYAIPGGNALSPVPDPAGPTVPPPHVRRDQIIEQLRNGPVIGRQIDIARTLAVPKTSLRRIIESDARLSMVAMEDGRSRLELVA